MKRILFFATAAIVALASCAKTEVVYKDAPREIAFKQITGAMTKTTLGDDNAGTMRVFAFKNDDHSSYFTPANGLQFTPVDADNWRATPSQYWPLSGSLDFVYFAPYSPSASVSYDATNYKLTMDLDNSKDVMYGKNVITGSKSNDAMPAPLRHALAKVIMKVTSDLEGLVIESFELSGPNVSGVLEVDYQITDDNGTANDERLTWPLKNTGDIAYTNLVVTTVKDTEYSDYHYVLPGDQTSFEFTYTLPGNATIHTYTHNLAGNKWLDGHQYTYVIKITANEIKLDPAVDVWADAATIDDIVVDPNKPDNN